MSSKNTNQTIYDFIIIGGGISGCSIANELLKYNILIIDKNSDVGKGASGAAGAFLSPLLGKQNNLKKLVEKSLIYSTKFYKENMPQLINNCGTIRIPKNEIDKIKFKSYIPYINFKFQEKEGGFLFDISSVVKSTKICQALTKDINKLLNYNVKSIKYEKNLWIIDEKIKTKKLILCNGASANLIDEPYFKIRKIWGQRIVCHTTTKLKYNYHKNCSISQTIKIDETKNLISIGATHKRDKLDEKTTNKETDELILKANEIKDIKNLEVVDQLGGFRACSVDYFPIVGEIIKHTKTLQEFPYLKHGTNVNEKRFTKHKNLYCLNGVGGRGFVLAPYLANVLADFIIDGKKLDNTITTTRLFKRWVKKQ